MPDDEHMYINFSPPHPDFHVQAVKSTQRLDAAQRSPETA
jgi:hypothetical protein